MASKIDMSSPVCLIENINEQLMVNKEALNILSGIKQPLVVVAIVGLYRTGKSYLMNKLAGKKRRFSVGSTVQSHTKGIWMWCVPHPNIQNHTLVLLDTEGLGDVEKVDEKNDTQIFALAILLSSIFVYNTMNKIDQESIDLLYNVTELINLLKARCSPDYYKVEDAADSVRFFPDLVWTLRDFFLELEIDGQVITADEYLENSLRPKQGTDKRVQNFNLPRLCIQKFFPKKKCFIFELPSDRKKLAQHEILRNDELDPDFVQQVAEFCSYIFSHSKIKTLPGDIKNLVLTYVNAINNGFLPCMENAVLAMAWIENSAAVQKAIAHYDQKMVQKVQLSTETLQELLDLHRASEREAIQVFMKSSFKDMDQKFLETLEIQLEAKLEYFCKQNLQASSDRCSALLRDIFSPLEEEVCQGIYYKPGGYLLYTLRRKGLKKTYCEEPRKGIKAEEALQKYLMSKESVSSSILQTELFLTAKKMELEEARWKAEAAWVQAQRLMEIQRQNQQVMEQRERFHQEGLRRLERVGIYVLVQQQRAQERIFQEQARKLNETFQVEIRRHRNEVQNHQSTPYSPNATCFLQ